MRNLDKNDHISNKSTEKFEIDSELSKIVEKKLLSPRIAEKIQKKLKESNVKISKEQLYNLVEKIQDTMQKYDKFGSSESKKIITDDADMKKLVDTIEKLGKRIKTIEENQFEKLQGITGKTVNMNDITTGTKKYGSLQEEIEPLTVIPNDPENIVVLMKWLQYLVDKLGKHQLPDILGYYADIGWISDDVRFDIMNYSKGITNEITKKEIEKTSANLSTKDHIQSLLFIQRLKGRQIDDRFMFRLDREIEKMAKSIEDYQFK